MLEQRLRRLHQRSRRVDDVVDHKRRTSADVADQVHHFAHVHVDSPLVDDGQRRVDPLGEIARALDAARIRRNHRHRPELLLLKILHQHRRGEQVIHRNVEISLNLRRVQIERKHSARPRRLQQIRHELRRNRHARAVLAILPRVRVIRNHRRDAPCRRALERVDHQQQLHQVEIHRIAAGLHDEDVGAANVFENLIARFAVRKLAVLGASSRHAEILADGIRKSDDSRCRKKP